MTIKPLRAQGRENFVNVGELSEILGSPIRGDLIVSLGCEPVHEAVWRGTYWHREQIPEICAALADHMENIGRMHKGAL